MPGKSKHPCDSSSSSSSSSSLKKKCKSKCKSKSKSSKSSKSSESSVDKLCCPSGLQLKPICALAQKVEICIRPAETKGGNSAHATGTVPKTLANNVSCNGPQPLYIPVSLETLIALQESNRFVVLINQNSVTGGPCVPPTVPPAAPGSA